MLAYLLKIQRYQVIIDKERILSEKQKNEFFEMVNKRLIGMPFQYILNSKEFMGLEFYVDERVLIPRNDTENLVEYLVNYFFGKEISFIDIGTGSGAISISLLKYLEKSYGMTIDISSDAIEVAKINAKRIGVFDRLTFIENDVLKGISNDVKVDLIVSNPPYIPKADINSLQIEVRDYEPMNALDGGEDGLDFYREIINSSYRFLKEDGVLAFEVGYNQAEDVKNIIDNSKLYKDVIFIKDLSGFDRCVIAKKASNKI